MPEFRNGHFPEGVSMPVEGSAWPEYTQGLEKRL